MTEATASEPVTLQVEAPQLLRVLTSEHWTVDAAVWHNADWIQTPRPLLEALVQLRDAVQALPDDVVRRLDVRCERHD